MFQIAVFIDAGYLYAQGSALLGGSKQPRQSVRLNVPAMLKDIVEDARAAEPNARLLRIYWYDGLPRGGALSIEQRTIAESDGVKCRLGTINSRGEQKGVDSLIVTDLIELARGGAISDALILSGDEDIRVGVQVAQSFGIRVHLLGIEPSRGSQSPDLVAEADTTREWGRARVAAWLTIVDHPPSDPMTDAVGSDDSRLQAIVNARVKALARADAQKILVYAQDNRNQLPADFDRPALGSARLALGRDLTPDERKRLRLDIVEELRSMVERDGGTG